MRLNRLVIDVTWRFTHTYSATGSALFTYYFFDLRDIKSGSHTPTRRLALGHYII